MRGLMQDSPLLVTKLLDYAADWHAEQEIITQTVEGPIHTYTWKDCRRRAQLSALALQRLGVKLGDRVATLGWNTARHLEVWYGIMGIGAICHTLNPRLFPKDLTYIANHAEDCVLILDLTFIKLVEALKPHLKSVKSYIILTDRAHMPKDAPKGAWLCYDDLLEAEVPRLPSFQWAQLDENTACGLCYTSGTTGRPKGVLYSHRSNYLQAFVVALPDAINLTSSSVVLPIVPMFHANSWGIVFSAPLVGARFVLPGPKLDGKSMYELMTATRTNCTAGVPTVCAGLLQHCDENNLKLDFLETVCIGGAACPPSMLDKFRNKHGVTVRHLWGMTEISPIGTIGGLKEAAKQKSAEEQRKILQKQGRPHVLVDMRIVDDKCQPLPHDGKTAGDLQVRGPHVIKTYFRHDGDHNVDKDGWFTTGDVATICPLGHMAITDRSKDVIKSGGEWISSIEVENAACGCPGVEEAAVIGVPHPKWSERPLLIIVRSAKSKVTKDEILGFLKGKIANWWIPEDVAFVDEIPHTATGKISKLELRQTFKDYKGPASKM